jgi:two-component system, OmpR family, heavy metal sensor histidine kinase CusS
MIKLRIPSAVWVGLTIFSTTAVLAVIALLALQAARMALLDSVLDIWAIREAHNTWHAEPASMSMDLPAEFGSARSAELLVLVADQFGDIRSRSGDWPTDIDPSTWVVKSSPVVMVVSPLSAPVPTWAPHSVSGGMLPAGVAATVVQAGPGPWSPPAVAPTQSVVIASHSGGEITLRHFLTHGRTGTVRWVAARATPGTVFAGVRENIAAEAMRPLAWIFGAIVVSASLLGSGLTHLILMAGRGERENLTEWVRQAADGLTTSTDPPGRDRELEELRLHLARLQGRLVVSLEHASRFTGDAAHELRSPLTAMQVKVDRLIQRSDPASEVQKDLADIADDIHRLSSLVRRLFWLALSDAGRLQLHRVPVDLTKVLLEAAQETLETATRLASELRVDPELHVEGDLALLTHAVTNLMSNAVKHNRAGGWVTVTATAQAAHVQVSVRNSVAHALPLLRDRVFERFFRGSFARGESVEGSGIGLSLAREIARAHGGDIVVADSPAEEACFILSLPILSASALVSPSTL